MMLKHMMALQKQMQVKHYGADPGSLEGEERIQFIKDMKLALEAELQEALDEVGWKPWATSRHVNEEAFKGELVDAWHFFMNLCLVANMGPQELYDRYLAKRQKNIARQVAGYDGVTGKCPQCKRALDDEAVTCTEEVCNA
jgi:dimeric dUTPase (all-alpha-NTP-PPase superfamily)